MDTWIGVDRMRFSYNHCHPEASSLKILGGGHCTLLDETYSFALTPSELSQMPFEASLLRAVGHGNRQAVLTIARFEVARSIRTPGVVPETVSRMP